LRRTPRARALVRQSRKRRADTRLSCASWQ
jgi:hypothetical protein